MTQGGSGGSTALFGVGEEDLVNVLKALTRIGSQMHGQAAGVGTADAVTQEISNLAREQS